MVATLTSAAVNVGYINWTGTELRCLQVDWNAGCFHGSWVKLNFGGEQWQGESVGWRP